ncbi:MAG: hypothetical protein V7K46_17330 [Nostoc sp.]
MYQVDDGTNQVMVTTIAH